MRGRVAACKPKKRCAGFWASDSFKACRCKAKSCQYISIAKTIAVAFGSSYRTRRQGASESDLL